MELGTEPIRRANAGTPIFQTVLGKAWHDLGEVIRRHYFLRPFGEDAITVRGTMDEVEHSAIAALLIPLARVFGALVPYKGRDVPIEVHYATRPDDEALYWDRVFHFEGRPPFHFRSRMEHAGRGQVIEFVRFGVGTRLRVSAKNGVLVFHDEGYVWRLFGINVPIPLGLLLGRAYIEERPVNHDTFTMRMDLVHPLFGEIFRYSGRFKLDEPAARSESRAPSPPLARTTP
ncbi:DUF4166 domain-containing protein [Aureimonas mangrovi]|uniref:DUF4166 domain-containing protein n=1 Tax=Aureimonas mangrovi TaxID=2758041 RepID=UPI00163D885E|nr:DUF4166 domain-containing protein [Aureimonas mangrovi]